MLEKIYQLTAYFMSQQIRLPLIAEKIGVQVPANRRFSVQKSLPAGGRVYYFSFGAVTFVNVSESDRLSELHDLSSLAANEKNPTRPFVESFLVVEDLAAKPRVDFNQICLDQLTQAREEVVASVVGQSAAMEYFENVVERIWEKVDQLLLVLRNKGKISHSTVQLNKDVGEAIRMRSEVVSILHLLDRPDLIWEDKIMDTLFNDLRSNFDLQERFQALEYKLGLIQDTLEILIETVRDRRIYWLEVAIVALIMVEIAFTILEKLHIW
jgi:uncharacterized Rmd1/YagE family protein